MYAVPAYSKTNAPLQNVTTDESSPWFVPFPVFGNTSEPTKAGCFVAPSPPVQPEDPGTGGGDTQGGRKASAKKPAAKSSQAKGTKHTHQAALNHSLNKVSSVHHFWCVAVSVRDGGCVFVCGARYELCVSTGSACEGGGTGGGCCQACTQVIQGQRHQAQSPGCTHPLPQQGEPPAALWCVAVCTSERVCVFVPRGEREKEKVGGRGSVMLN
jgi:hypothetical protein